MYSLKLGVDGYVPNYFIGIGVLAIITITAAPVTLCATSFLKPCMPPSFFTMTTLPCKDWDDIRGNFLAKTLQAVFAAYTGLVIFSTLTFGLFVLLYYPVAVQLLLLDGLKRYPFPDSHTDVEFAVFPFYVCIKLSTN